MSNHHGKKSFAAPAEEPAAMSADLPPIVANTMLVDNPQGTARENKTFPQVRSLLAVPAIDQLPWVDGASYGITGNAGDNHTAALQHIVDNVLPAEGGVIRWRGYANFDSQLNLYGRRNIIFKGEGGDGAGALQRTVLRFTGGAIGFDQPAIKAWKTMGIGFENLQLLTSNPLFDGVLLDFNAATPQPGDDSALMHLRDMYVGVVGTAFAKGVDLYGATSGNFHNVQFAGRGKLVALQDVAGVGFCNTHQFLGCHFKPSGSEYPVVGSGEAITFIGGNAQASSSDGIGRFWITSQNQPFKSINIIGMSFYDVITHGGIWNYFFRGRGLQLNGLVAGGAASGANYFASIGGGPNGSANGPGNGFGVTGFNVIGGNYEYFTAVFSYAGLPSTWNHVRDGVVLGASAVGGMAGGGHTVLESNAGATRNIIRLAPYILDGTVSETPLVDARDLPAFANRTSAIAAGLTTGQLYVESTSGERHLCSV